MPYRILQGESVESALIRIGREQVDTALGELADTDLSDLDRARQVRRRTKRVRALLRLVRGGLGKGWLREDRWFRDRSRELAPFRDMDVRIVTLDALLAAAPDLAQAPGVAAMRARMVAERDALRADGRLDQALERTRLALLDARERIDGWQVRGDGFAVLRAGLAGEYREGRRALRRASAGDDPVRRHEWRRLAKYHWLHATLLREIWPATMEPYIAQVREIVDLVGDEHNLVVLGAYLWPEGAGSGPPASGAPEELRERTDQQRVVLLERAGPLGRYLYAERPGALVRRWEAWWTLWRTP